MPVNTRSGMASHSNRDDAAPQPAFPDPLPPPPSQERHEQPASLSRDDDVPVSPFRADMTFTNENVASIIASLQKSQTEALRDLLLSVTRANSSTPVQSQVPGEGTLARCKAQFSGQPHESVEAFIDAVEAYSECAQVSSANILRGLAYLFTDEAATWWQGIKNTIASWEQAKDNLIGAYGDRRPPHRIYLELFARPQLYDENTDIFVARSRALLSKIPERDISEKARLDMIYGLLHSKIRIRLRREEFDSFQQLLRHARNIEDSQGESDANKPTRDHRTAPRVTTTYAVPRVPNSTAPQSVPRVLHPPAPPINARQPPTSAATARLPAPPPPPRPPPQPSHDAAAAPAARRQRPTCTYCKRFGHTRDQCRKLQNLGESQSPTNYSPSVRDNSDNTVRDRSEPFYSVESRSFSRNVRNHYNQCSSNRNFKDSNSKINKQNYRPSNNQLNSIASNSITDRRSYLPISSQNDVITSCENLSDNDIQRVHSDPVAQSRPRKYSKKLNKLFDERSRAKMPQCNNKQHTQSLEICSRCNSEKCKFSHSCDYVNNSSQCSNNKYTQSLEICSKCNLEKCNFSRSCDYVNNLSQCNINQQPIEMCSSCNSEKSNFSQSCGHCKKKPQCSNDKYSQSLQNFCKCNFENNKCSQSGENLNIMPQYSEAQYAKSLPKCSKCNFVKCCCYKNVNEGDVACTRGDNNVESPISCDLRPIFNINILGHPGTALIDTAAKHCIAGHTLYALLLRLGHPLHRSWREVKLADGVIRNMEVLTTTLPVRLEQTLITIPFLIFPDANNNETLLGIDFITAAKIVIDFHLKIWYFSGTSTLHNLSFEPTSHTVSCASTEVLRDDEGSHLNPAERQALADVLTRHAHIFRAGGGPTSYAEHRIETGEHPLIAVPPYHLNPSKKEQIKVECESAWCSPALMVPKSDGGNRFFVDYRRLNAVTKSDTYPMPRIDELLQNTKKERVETQQDKTKKYADASRKPSETFQVGDLVLIKSHLLSKGSSNLTAKFFPRRDGPYQITEKAALCADYSVPVDCVAAGPAPRPSSFHEISAPKVEFIEAYCTPRDTARRSPLRSRRSREPRRSPDSSKWRYDSRRGYDFDSSRRPYDYDSRRYYGDSGRRAEFDAESARRRADYESARRTDFDLSAPGVSRRSPESAPEGSADSPPEPAPSAPLRHERQPRHRSQQYYESETSSDDRSSSSEEEDDEFGEFDPFATAPSLHSPDSGRSDPRYANAPRRNPSPYYYGDLFKTAPPPPAPSAPTASTTSSSRGPRYRKSASLDAPHVAPRPNLPKRFSVAEDGFRELERSSSSSGESAWMPPRRRGRDAAGCACAAPEDVEEHRSSRSVFYVPAPLPRWPQEMTSRQIYETAFDCKIARSDDDLDDFDRVSNHPALLQAEERKVISSASSAFEAVERSEPDYKGRRKVTMKTDSVRRSKIPTIRQKRENESNACALSEELEKVHIEEEERTASTSQLPLRGYTPSPPSTAPLPTKFQKDGSAMNSIKSAPNLPQSQPAHPRLKDLRLPVKSLRARETPTSSDASMADVKGSASVELDIGQRLRDSSRESRDGDEERQSKDGIFLEIKGRPTSDSDTPELNRYSGPKGVGPIMEFKGRPGVARPRRKYSSTESMATSSSGGSMESLRSSNSEGDRSSSSSESRHSSSLSSHSSDSGNVPFTKSHHMQLSGFGHHPAKLHILSPISDKSSQEPASETSDNNKNNNSQKVSPEDAETGNTTVQTTVEIVAKPKRRALQNRNLLNLTFRHSTTGDAEIQGSDSGISIHSREGVDSRNAFINFKNSNTEEERKDEDLDFSDLPFDMPKLRRRRAEAEADLRSLPFDMPKLRRKLRGQSLQLNNDFGGVISNASSSQSVQDLNQGNKHRAKLTLNFESGSGGSGSSKGLHLNLGPIAPPRDLVDASLPLDRQGWYHGTLTRIEAESLLRNADEGAFLVRNSESAKHDYSLSLKSTRGFMHMRICRGTEGYTLGGAATAFPTVPALMKHYVTAQRLPVRGAEHMALSTPLPAVLL